MSSIGKLDLTRLARPHLLGLEPYSSARDEYRGAAGIFLDANENALGSVGGGAHHRYPDPHQRSLKHKLAEIRNISPNRVFLGNGSDEAIDLLIRAFCEPGKDEILICPPTYGMYRVAAEINAVSVKEVPLQADFQINSAAIIERISPQTKLIFLCSPNNPTGNVLDPIQVEQVLEVAPGLVILDEAYIDFTPDSSMVSYLAHYPQLVILQTFSKAWGLARLRLGMAYAHSEVIALLDRIKPPYNVNGLTQELALLALHQAADMEASVAVILGERQRLAEALQTLPLVEQVYPSEANFLLVKVDDAHRRYAELTAHRIIVRNRSTLVHCAGCLRITVGTAAENDLLIQALTDLSHV